MDVFKLLTSTYPRYVDSESREAVEEVGILLVRRDELRGTPRGETEESKVGVTEQVLGWMSQEVGRIAKRSRCVITHAIAPCRDEPWFIDGDPDGRSAVQSESWTGQQTYQFLTRSPYASKSTLNDISSPSGSLSWWKCTFA